MSINLGSNPFGLYLGSTKIAEAYVGNVKVYGSSPTPVVLPDHTLRFKFNNTSYTPSSSTSSVGTWTAVDRSNGVWDWYYNNSSWQNAFNGKITSARTGNVNIIGANLTGVNTLAGLFYNCTSLHEITCDFDLTDVAGNIGQMFYGCTTLVNSPITVFGSGITSVTGLYYNCYLMENAISAWGILARSPAGTLFSSDSTLMKNCGLNSSTNMLANIPDSVGGNKAAVLVSSNYASIRSGSKSASASIQGPFKPGDYFGYYISGSNASGGASLSIDATNTCKNVGGRVSYGDVYNASVTGYYHGSVSVRYIGYSGSVTVYHYSYNAIY